MLKILNKNKYNFEEKILFLLCNPISLFLYCFGIKVKLGTIPFRPFFSPYVFLALFLIMFFVLKKISDNSGFKFKKNFLFFLVIFPLYLLIFSFLFSATYRESISSYYEIANVILPLSFAYLSRNRPIYLIHSLFYLSLINIFYTFFQFLGLFPAISSILSVGSINPIFYRFSGLFTNSVNSSFISAFFLIIFIYYKKLIPKFFAKRFFIIFYFGAYLYSFSRVSIMFLFSWVLIKEITRTKRNLINLSFTSIGLFLTIWLINSPLTRLSSAFSLSRATDDINLFDPYDIDAPRLLRIEHFFNAIFDRIPMLGPYNDYFLTFSFFPDTLQKFGIVFGFLFYVFIGFLLINSLRYRKIFFTIGIVCIFTTFQLTNGILNAQFYLPTFLFYLFAGWILLDINIYNNNSSKILN